jgi:hypothetical protein
LPSFSPKRQSCTRMGGWAKCTERVDSSSGISARASAPKGVRAAVSRRHFLSKRKRHHYIHEWKRGRGLCASGWPSPVRPYGGCALFYRGVGDEGKTRTHEARRRWGKDSFLPPNSCAARAPRPVRAGSARKSGAPKHLGPSSPSGNARGECRGCCSLGTDAH